MTETLVHGIIGEPEQDEWGEWFALVSVEQDGELYTGHMEFETEEDLKIITDHFKTSIEPLVVNTEEGS